MTAIGSSLFISGAISGGAGAVQLDINTGAVLRSFDPDSHRLLGVSSGAMESGMLALGVSSGHVRFYHAFCLDWSREQHHKFPDAAKQYAVVFVLLRILGQEDCAWPDQQVLVDIMMQGLTPKMWNLE